MFRGRFVGVAGVGAAPMPVAAEAGRARSGATTIISRCYLPPMFAANSVEQRQCVGGTSTSMVDQSRGGLETSDYHPVGEAGRFWVRP